MNKKQDIFVHRKMHKKIIEKIKVNSLEFGLFVFGAAFIAGVSRNAVLSKNVYNVVVNSGDTTYSQEIKAPYNLFNPFTDFMNYNKTKTDISEQVIFEKFSFFKSDGVWNIQDAYNDKKELFKDGKSDFVRVDNYVDDNGIFFNAELLREKQYAGNEKLFQMADSMLLDVEKRLEHKLKF